jgi:predicted PurR-regulated permease PerM
LTAFLILRVKFAVVLAFVVAIIDLLPLLGVGTILIPWAVISFASGDYSRGVFLIVTYGVIAVVRNIVEPKLIAGQIGLPPIATLLAMYVGFCAIGVLGMALFPIGLIMLKHLNDRGYVKLWK